MKKWKLGLGIVSLMSAMYIGDKLNVIDNVINPIRYHNIIISEKCYNEPFDLEKIYKINANGELEVYFGANGEYYLVEDEVRVHPKTFKEFTENPFEDVSDFISNIMEKYFRVTWNL